MPPIHPASNDSDDVQANMAADHQLSGVQMDAGTSNNPTDKPTSPLTPGAHSSQTNGHQDPKQRRIYLALLASSVAFALLGLVLLLIWVLHFRSEPGIGFGSSAKMSNLHPVLMYIFFVSINMYSILVYRTHYDMPKTALKWIHGGLLGVSMLAAWVGVAAIWRAHQIDGKADFYSLHSWIGALTNLLFFLQFVMAFVTFVKPGLTPKNRSLVMVWHRMSGALILVLASVASLTGILEMALFQGIPEYTQFGALTFLANFTGVCIIFVAIVAIYLVTAAQYRRPSPPEEQPFNNKR